jgi:hypothetical protein
VAFGKSTLFITFTTLRMMKKVTIFICLLVFCFQAILFNAFLYGVILSSKIDESGYTKQLSLTQNQFKNLNWLSKNEFSIGNYLVDVKDIQCYAYKIVLSYKVDLQEKNFLEKLAEDLKNSKNKKLTSSSFVFQCTEPQQFGFFSQSKEFFYKKMHVSIRETVKEKNSPPPKV